MINKQCHKEDQVIKKTREYSNNDEVQLLYNGELRTKALRDQLEKHGLRLRTRTDEPYHIYNSTEIDRKEGTYDLDGFVPFGNRTDTTSDCPYPSQRLSGGIATQAA